MAEIQPATFADALHLADRLRFEDAREITSCWGLGARAGLFHCLLQSERCFTLLEQDQPEALWGVSEASADGLSIGIPWMLAGERLFDRTHTLLERSRRVLLHLLAGYDVLTNLTDAGNDAHLRWLARCGFEWLRRHEHHGVAGRPFVEFYRINPRRAVPDAAVRAILLRRRPAPSEAPRNVIADALVKLAITVLDGQWTAAGAAELVSVLRALADPQGVDQRIRPGCVRLLLEVAVRLNDTCERQAAGRLARHTPLRELVAALADAADVLVLERAPGGAELVLALDPRLSRRGIPRGDDGNAGIRPVQVRPVQDSGAAALQALLRRYVRMLTLDGRVGRTAGFELWSVAVGAGDPDGEAGGDAGAALQRLLGHRRFTRSPRADAGGGNDVSDQTRTLLAMPLGHGRALAGMRAASRGRGPVAGAVKSLLDGWGAPGSPTADIGAIGTVEDALSAASAIADHVALQVLPSLRVGGIVSGYADRHKLYRLLRVRLLAAAAGTTSRALIPLLVHETWGLVIAGRLEHRLLMVSSGAPDQEELAALLREAILLRDPAGVLDDPCGDITRLLLPALAIPVVHALQLPCALLAWHLAASDQLELERLDDFLPADGLASRRRYRNFLRKLANEIDLVAFSRELGVDPDTGPIDHDPLRALGDEG